MRAYTLAAPAKITLHLEIIGDRPDGFHELVMILQSVALPKPQTPNPKPQTPKVKKLYFLQKSQNRQN